MLSKTTRCIVISLLCTGAPALVQAASEEEARDSFAGQRMLVTYREGRALYGTRFLLQIDFCRSGNYMTVGRSVHQTVLNNEQVNNFNDQGRWTVTTIDGQLYLTSLSVSGQSNSVPLRLLPNGSFGMGGGISAIPQGAAQCR